MVMGTSNFNKIVIFLTVVVLYSSTMFCLLGAEDDVLHASAAEFVCQICERDTNAILRSYPMTNEFRAGMPNADTVIGWAREIDRLFGRLGDVRNSEIVEHHNQGLRRTPFKTCFGNLGKLRKCQNIGNFVFIYLSKSTFRRF